MTDPHIGHVSKDTKASLTFPGHVNTFEVSDHARIA